MLANCLRCDVGEPFALKVCGIASSARPNLPVRKVIIVGSEFTWPARSGCRVVEVVGVVVLAVHSGDGGEVISGQSSDLGGTFASFNERDNLGTCSWGSTWFFGDTSVCTSHKG